MLLCQGLFLLGLQERCTTSRRLACFCVTFSDAMLSKSDDDGEGRRSRVGGEGGKARANVSMIGKRLVSLRCSFFKILQIR